jgi:hypothetical protein
MTPPTARCALRRASAVAVLLIVLSAVAGCVPTTGRPHPTPTGLAHPDSVAPLVPLISAQVVEYCPVEDAAHYSGYPLPVDEVYICRGDGSKGTDGISTYGPWESAYRIMDPIALLTAYRKPDAQANGRHCGPFPADPLIIWVHHAGVTKAYYAPVDRCGVPSASSAAAYQNAKRVLLVEVDRGVPDSSRPGSPAKEGNG